MADDTNETDGALEKQQASKAALAKVHKRAIARFDECALPQLEMRRLSLEARRFVSIPGAQWDGLWGEQFDKSIKVEVNKVGRGVEKIETDYRENRIAPDFRPDGKDADQDTADMLDGLLRADSYRFKAQQARDNAFMEAVRGGFGAYRLTNEWEDPSDKGNDFQRINPAGIIVDADQCVFFDANSKLYDKSDARFAFVITAWTRDAVEEEFGETSLTEWPAEMLLPVYRDWFTTDVVRIAEYWEVENRDETLWIATHKLSAEERRYWANELVEGQVGQMRAQGWQMSKQTRPRRRVHKYVMSGAEVLEDRGTIAGEHIPVVPVYGKRLYVDNVERFKGYVQDKMDSQRVYNAQVSKLTETASLAPREIPIFAAEQMPPHLAEQWANMNIERHPYALVEPLRDENGGIVAAGPIGKVEPPQVPQVQAALLQISNTDLMEELADGADEVKANTSAEAMDIAASRVDAKSGIYLDNMRQSVQREAEIYLSMASEIYADEGREVETMSEDGDDGRAILMEPVTDATTGAHRLRNDLQRGKYKVIASVSEATATRRDKTVRSMLGTAEIAIKAGDTELAQAALYNAVLNQDGEGISDLHQYVRKKAVAAGYVEPNEEEKAAMEQAAESQQPDPTAQALMAQAKELDASAGLKLAQTEKTAAETVLTEAKTLETLASAEQKGADAHTKLNPPAPANDSGPRISWGRDLATG